MSGRPKALMCVACHLQNFPCECLSDFLPGFRLVIRCSWVEFVAVTADIKLAVFRAEGYVFAIPAFFMTAKLGDGFGSFSLTAHNYCQADTAACRTI